MEVDAYWEHWLTKCGSAQTETGQAGGLSLDVFCAVVLEERSLSVGLSQVGSSVFITFA